MFSGACEPHTSGVVWERITSFHYNNKSICVCAIKTTETFRGICVPQTLLAILENAYSDEWSVQWDTVLYEVSLTQRMLVLHI